MLHRQTSCLISPKYLVVLLALAVAGCASPLIKKPLPENLQGKLNIQKVHVEKIPGINSVRIVGVVRTALSEKVREKLSTGKNAEMHVVIEKYQGPETQVGGSRLARLSGSTSKIQALIKIIDPADETVLSEYRAVADYKTGGLLTGTVSFHDTYQGLMYKFTHFALDPIT